MGDRSGGSHDTLVLAAYDRRRYPKFFLAMIRNLE